MIEVAGLRTASPDTLPNLAIDLASIGTIGYFWKRELDGQEKRLRRISMGAAISKLRVQPLGGELMGKSVKLVELRSGRDTFGESARRVVVVCAEAAALGPSLAKARAYSQRLSDADLLIVPMITSGNTFQLPPPELVRGAEGDADADAVGHLALAQGLDTWGDVLKEELEVAISQDADVAARGFTLILKKNGRVGTRRLGLPEWDALVDDVANRKAAGLDTTNI